MNEETKVSWTREETFENGTTIAISEKTGIVKVTVPGTGRRSVMLYRDEMQTFFDCLEGVKQYINKNQDAAVSKEQAKETKQIKRTQVKTEAKVIEGLQALGYSDEKIKTILDKAS